MIALIVPELFSTTPTGGSTINGALLLPLTAVRLDECVVDEIGELPLLPSDESRHPVALGFGQVFHLEALRSLRPRQQMPRAPGYIQFDLLKIETDGDDRFVLARQSLSLLEAVIALLVPGTGRRG